MTENVLGKAARRFIWGLLPCLALLLTFVGARTSQLIHAVAPRTLSAGVFPASRDVPKAVPVGGLQELPPDPPPGNNVISNPSLESGGTGWTLGRCWSVDNSTGHQGTHSLRYDAGPDCGKLSIAETSMPRHRGAPRTYSMQGWVKTSEDSDLKVRLTLHDRNDRSYALGGTRYNFVPGPTWQLIDSKNMDLFAAHDAHTLSVFAMADGQKGTAWFDDIELIEQPPPQLSVFMLYPNYRGYLWSGGPESVRFHAEVSVPALSKVKLHAVLQDESTGRPVKTVDQPAEASQEIRMDGSALPLGSYTARVELDDSSGIPIALYPGYRVVKVAEDFRNTMVNYIDADNFLVRKGQKRFLWGVYDRMSARFRLPPVGRTSDEGFWESIPGFGGLSTVDSYADCRVNAEINILPFAGISTNHWHPWFTALDRRGVGHLQILVNWVETDKYRPYWARGLSDVQLWKTAIAESRGQPGALGYYTFDEPHLEQRPQVFSQYRVLREGDPGGISYGALIDSRSIFRWRDLSDAIGSDPYPIGTVVGIDDVPFGANQPPPMLRTSVWTREAVRQVYDSRPVWMVLQLFRLGGKFPTYEQMKEQAYKAIINGAHGILWWGFVYSVGMEGQTYEYHDTQAYPDFRRISHEVMALEPILISPPQPGLVASVSDPQIEYLVKSDSKRIVIFASNFGETPITRASFTLASSAPQVSAPIEVYSEIRTIEPQGRTFSDSFAPYECHVYIIKRP